MIVVKHITWYAGPYSILTRVGMDRTSHKRAFKKMRAARGTRSNNGTSFLIEDGDSCGTPIMSETRIYRNGREVSNIQD